MDGHPKFHEAFAAFTTVPQTYAPNIVGEVPLQIVPVITASGIPDGANAFGLVGSGFMEAGSMITIGGIVIQNLYANQGDSDVTGARNSNYQLVAPVTVEGPIRVTTAGGFHQIAGPVFGLPAFVKLTGIRAQAAQGVVANGAVASANTGQAITLLGKGFTNSTLVQFDAQDDAGVNGIPTRTGSASGDGTSLTVILPALARTGNVRVVGDADTTLALQIVPTLQNAGGTIATTATGVFDVKVDALMDFWTGTDGQFINAGTVRKTAGSGTAGMDVLVNNAGTVAVQSGTLRFGGGGTHTGIFSVDSATVLQFSAGTHNINAGSIGRTGFVSLSGATVNAKVALSIDHVTLTAGTLNGSELLVLTGTGSQWTGGTRRVGARRRSRWGRT